MAVNNQKVTKPKRDRTNENFEKRVKSLMKKSNDLSEFEAKVFLFVICDRKSYAFNLFTEFLVLIQEFMVRA